MMKIYSYPSETAEKKIKAIIHRKLGSKQKDLNRVNRILEDVRKNGDDALIQYINQFDSPGMTLNALRVTTDEFASAAKTVNRSYMGSLNRAISRITTFHRKQVRQSWIDTEPSGIILGQLIHPVQTVGVYVPGGKEGKTPLISSALMGVIPARIAGVKRIYLATPSMKDGHINSHLLVAAKKTGVDAVYKMGSAWAIAALAFGTETVPKVDMIVGPGNMYVTLAKKILTGSVGIDMIAGPSEVLVIADKNARPDYIAADLLSQAEHDVMASAVLITDRSETADAVNEAIVSQLDELPRKAIARTSLEKFGGIFVVSHIAEAITLSNRIAPEHLELQIGSPYDYIGRIRNAGAVFLGDLTPEAIGDYIAGPNHVLPTAGTARFSSALSVDHFVKKSSLIHYSEKAFIKDAPHVIRLAEVEGLDAHAHSVKIRLKGKKE